LVGAGIAAKSVPDYAALLGLRKYVKLLVKRPENVCDCAALLPRLSQAQLPKFTLLKWRPYEIYYYIKKLTKNNFSFKNVINIMEVFKTIQCCYPKNNRFYHTS